MFQHFNFLITTGISLGSLEGRLIISTGPSPLDSMAKDTSKGGAILLQDGHRHWRLLPLDVQVITDLKLYLVPSSKAGSPTTQHRNLLQIEIKFDGFSFI